MPLRIFKNNNGQLEEVSAQAGTDQIKGWFNRLEPADLDNDGDLDFVVGNFGWNSQINASVEEPVSLYSKDFDNNGQIDPILCYYVDGENYPAFSKDDMEKQLPMIKRKFVKYSDYADKKLTEIFSAEELEGASVLEANQLSTGYFENQGDGTFRYVTLPIEVQVSPTYAIHISDIDQDGNLDLIMGGNFLGTRVKFGEYDSSFGTILKGDGQGGFVSIPSSETGILIRGEVRDIVALTSGDKSPLILWARNNDTPVILKKNPLVSITK
jgi:hypothetical protein